MASATRIGVRRSPSRFSSSPMWDSIEATSGMIGSETSGGLRFLGVMARGYWRCRTAGGGFRTASARHDDLARVELGDSGGNVDGPLVQRPGVRPRPLRALVED